MWKETFTSEILEEKKGLKNLAIIKWILNIFKKHEEVIFSQQEIIDEIKDIDWNRHLEDLWLNFEDFKEKIKNETFQEWKLEDSLKSKKLHIQFAKRILEVYGFLSKDVLEKVWIENFYKKYDLTEIEKLGFSWLELIDWKLNWTIRFNTFARIEFYDNLILKSSHWVEWDFVHINIDGHLVSFDSDSWVMFEKNHFSQKENLKLYVNWKKVKKDVFRTKYFKYSPSWNMWEPTGWWIAWTHYLNDSRCARNRFLIEDFTKDLEEWKIPLSNRKTLKYNMGTLEY